MAVECVSRDTSDNVAARKKVRCRMSSRNAIPVRGGGAPARENRESTGQTQWRSSLCVFR